MNDHRDPAAEGIEAAKADARMAYRIAEQEREDWFARASAEQQDAYRKDFNRSAMNEVQGLGRAVMRHLDAAGFARMVHYEHGGNAIARAGHNLQDAIDNYDPMADGPGYPVALIFGYMDDRDGGDGLDKPLAEPMAHAMVAALVAAGLEAEYLAAGEGVVSPCVAVTGRNPVEVMGECAVCDREFQTLSQRPGGDPGLCRPCDAIVTALEAYAEANMLDDGLCHTFALQQAERLIRAVGDVGDRGLPSMK